MSDPITYTFEVGMNLRCYGQIDVTAASYEEARAQMTPDYIAENFVKTSNNHETPDRIEACLLEVDRGEGDSMMLQEDILDEPTGYTVWVVADTLKQEQHVSFHVGDLEAAKAAAIAQTLEAWGRNPDVALNIRGIAAGNVQLVEWNFAS